MEDSIGDRIRRLRTQRNLSQRALAGFADRSERWLWSVERGRTTVDIPEAERLALALRVEVGVLLDREDDNVKRRQFLQRSLQATAAAAALSPVDLVRALAAPSDRLVEDLTQVTREYAGLYWRISPPAMLRLLTDHETHLMEILRTVPGRPLQVLASETARLAGLAAYDHDDLGTARQHFGLAEHIAREAGDGPALAAAMTAHRCATSSTDAGGGGDRVIGGAAIEMLNEAERAVGRSGPRPVRAWLLCSRAEEYASLGRAREAFEDLDRAGTAVAGLDRSTPIGMFTPWDSARLDGWRASVLLYLQRPREAAELLERVIPATPRDIAGYRCAALANLSGAYALGGEVERAVALAGEALEIARHRGLSEGLSRVRSIRSRHLEPYAELPAVRQLDDQLRSII